MSKDKIEIENVVFGGEAFIVKCAMETAIKESRKKIRMWEKLRKSTPHISPQIDRLVRDEKRLFLVPAVKLYSKKFRKL